MAVIECHGPMGKQDVNYKNHILTGTDANVVKLRSSQMGCHVFCFQWVRCSILAKWNHLDLGQIKQTLKS